MGKNVIMSRMDAHGIPLAGTDITSYHQTTENHWLKKCKTVGRWISRFPGPFNGAGLKKNVQNWVVERGTNKGFIQTYCKYSEMAEKKKTRCQHLPFFFEICQHRRGDPSTEGPILNPGDSPQNQDMQFCHTKIHWVFTPTSRLDFPPSIFWWKFWCFDNGFPWFPLRPYETIVSEGSTLGG